MKHSKGLNKGFTLVEVIIVVGVIGIMAAIAVPAIMSWMPNIRLRGDAREMYATMQRAKMEAIKRNTCASIAFTTVAFPATGGGYTLFLDDGAGGGTACDGQQNGGEAVLTTIPMSTGISLVSASDIGGTKAVCFNSRALVCSSQSGNVQLRHPSRWYRLTVQAAGGFRMEKSADGANWSL